MFIRSARICSLCFKQCGAKIEAAHIVAEADGGSNDDENGIPLCFDCHQEVGAYNPRHPKGNKFTEAELKARRDQLYALVEGGTLQAMIVAEQLRVSSPGSLRMTSPDEVEKVVSAPYRPSGEAQAVLNQAKNQWGSVEALPGKIRLLAPRDRAFVIDQLIADPDNEQSLRSLFVIATSEGDADAARVILEQLVRRVTLLGSIEAKAGLLRNVPLDMLQAVDSSIRTAFFQDIIDIMRRDQYAEVNKITPAVIRTQSAIPDFLHGAYLTALLSQAESGAWYGAPAARGALRDLTDELARVGIQQIKPHDLLHYRYDENPIKTFLSERRDLWPQEHTAIFSGYVTMSYFDFVQKYGRE